MSKVNTLKHETVERRPAGTMAVLASLIVVVVQALGLEITSEEAAILIGGFTALVSKLSPRL